MARKFPNQQPGLNYLTEGGQETEILYKYGFELQQFAMFPLLDNPRAVTELRGMYGRYLDIAAGHGFGVVMGGLDYRASPDWGSLLGYSRESLADMQMRSISFLREVAQPYAEQVPALMYAGIVGPRGDAYEINQTITAEEAEEYHGEQLATLARARVDLVEAMTFNSVPEVIGLSRAAARVGLPLSVCTLGHLEAGDPVELGELMGGLARQYPHIDLWGGCCGTWETHLDEIARNVRQASAVGA
jgi:S-methylmethionine-dependent homocysteine/selenocysteine methylase